MSAFEKLIGYEHIKTELMQICDMIHHRDIYKKLGANMPKGVLLTGGPGLGKTEMAKAFIKESGLKAFTIRNNMNNDKFIEHIKETFENAKTNAPCIVFLDDLDKFGNEEGNHRSDSKEYVAVQAGIDEVKEAEVIVIATVNEEWKLPNSLLRAGRFDKRIVFDCPSDKDAASIIKHYVSQKNVSKELNYGDLTKMFSYISCARLETIINEAAIIAGFQKKNEIGMEDFISAVLKCNYHLSDALHTVDERELKKTAMHEAGHAVLSEALSEGSVGLVSIMPNNRGEVGGFMHNCKAPDNYEHEIMIDIAGKAAVELFVSNTDESGAIDDLRKAQEIIRIVISKGATRGYGHMDVTNKRSEKSWNPSDSFLATSEAIVQAELERYTRLVKDILIDQKEFAAKLSDALINKRTLLYSDIQRIKEECNTIAA